MLDRGITIVLSILTGVALEVGVHILSGRREAWDSTEYWLIGLPAVAVVSFALGLFARGTAWRWTILVIPAQVMTMMVRAGEVGNLWPLAIILGLILGMPFFAIAFVGSRLRSKQA